jgi:hypothetical protein
LSKIPSSTTPDVTPGNTEVSHGEANAGAINSAALAAAGFTTGRTAKYVETLDSGNTREDF